MTTIAVIAHSGKTFGGGLGELRQVLDDAGFDQPLWYEVAKSRQAPDCAREAMYCARSPLSLAVSRSSVVRREICTRCWS